MEYMEKKQNTELVEIIMNCAFDADYRKHAAIEFYRRAGVNESWQQSQEIMSQ